MNDRSLLPSLGSRELNSNSPDNSPLAEALAEYLELQESGNAPSRSDFVARFPEIAGPLEECLRQMDWIGQVAGDLSEDLLAGDRRLEMRVKRIGPTECWGIFASSARLAGAGWESFTKRSKSRWAAG